MAEDNAPQVQMEVEANDLIEALVEQRNAAQTMIAQYAAAMKGMQRKLDAAHKELAVIKKQVIPLREAAE
jgi:hypothetical protein